MKKDKAFKHDYESRILLPEEIVEEIDKKRNEEEAMKLHQKAVQAETEESENLNSKSGAAMYFGRLNLNNPLAEVEAKHRLYNIVDVRKGASDTMAADVDSDRRSRTKEVTKKLHLKGEYRRLAVLPADWRRKLVVLKTDFPNMGEVVDFLQSMLSIAAAGDKVLAFPGLLLNGPPGVGKTLFCDALAQAFGTEFMFIDMARQQEGATISGSAVFWGNTKTGEVFESLVYGNYANSLIQVDEIDKAHKNEYDPLAGLYALLEPHTAKNFADLSMPWLKLDASRLLWVCTANDPDLIPAPIRSRLREFDIQAPTDEQARHIAIRIFRDLCKTKLRRRIQPMSSEVLSKIRGLPPRRMRIVLMEGIGKALFDGRRHLLPQDIVKATEERRTIGFTANLGGVKNEP